MDDINSESKPVRDRRRFVRVGRKWTLVFQPLDRELRRVYKSEISGETRDTSEGGLLFRCSEEVPANSFIELEIRLPGDDRPVVAIAKVVRVAPLPEGKEQGYEIESVSRKGYKLIERSHELNSDELGIEIKSDNHPYYFICKKSLGCQKKK